ncbi:hypothetical protein B296_00004121 [Ensete ventricosum]|uniref:Uncharacterized protein n=1 Tax=Ensete ventricosum TaxID=4639 RepID=A0A427B0A9_ENSVE|nr:hypothetical protein B296_00004121 [Ensete ventricosum]
MPPSVHPLRVIPNGKSCLDLDNDPWEVFACYICVIKVTSTIVGICDRGSTSPLDHDLGAGVDYQIAN